jgi:hypothetical protein
MQNNPSVHHNDYPSPQSLDVYASNSMKNWEASNSSNHSSIGSEDGDVELMNSLPGK